MSRHYLILFFASCFLVLTLNQTNAAKAFSEPVETDAMFGNKPNDWERYLIENVNVNIPVTNCAPAGKYYVEVLFLLDRNGKIELVRSRTKHGYGMEEELTRVVRSSPMWKPATRNGRNCKQYRCETFIFEVGRISAALL